ncbi:MAG: hypothetical protein GXP05_00245 [Alphaproteobacteria bacterium]|nr:hypothetical protein [Alphaproteobacteria bacterium]
MNKTLILAALLAASASAGQAQTYGTGAYPDNWQGGPPLPPINQPMGYVQQPQGYYAQPRVQYVEPQETYMQPYYAQPQVRYAQPQAQVYLQPPIRYAQPQGRYVQTQTYVTRAYLGNYIVEQRAPLVQGPPQSRCVVANLNGTALQEGCGMVSINPADAPMLRQKFSAYRRNSGYVLNLPADSEYR